MHNKITAQFNLLYEPWITIRKKDSSRKEVSILGVFKEAHEFLALSGELPAQDTAILRILLAILHSVFNKFAEPYSALDKWAELWSAKQFPYEEIEQYLKGYEDRFYLIHPQAPFFQIPGLDTQAHFGPFNMAKLNGEVSESDHKARLFQHRSGDEKVTLSFAEAARWLLYFNAYAETFGKLEAKGKKGKSDLSVGVGWLGKLGLITALGDSLFETLMLNFVLLDESGALWDRGRPIWEKPVCFKERNAIAIPRNQAELLTLQSRRVLLENNGERVTAYRFISGDIFPKEESFSETMTAWKFTKQPGDKTERYRPKTFQQSVQLWRDFASLVSQNESARMPGVVQWLKRLVEEKDENGDRLLPVDFKYFRFQTSSILYGTMQAVIADVFSDSISFNSELLSDLHRDWIPRIIDELETTENLVRHVGILAQNIAKAAGNKYGHAEREHGLAQRHDASSQAYYRLDQPFRKWLESIEPKIENTGKMMDDKCGEWWGESQSIVRSLGKEIVSNCSPQALTGRNGLSAPQAFNWFLYNTTNRAIVKWKGGEKNGKSAKNSA